MRPLMEFKGASSVTVTWQGRELTGYASVFGGVDSYGDTIAPGAFKRSLEGRSRPVGMFLNHKRDNVPIGKWKNIAEDDKGLLVVGELTPGNRLADDVLASIRHGTVDGLSIGYHAKSAEKSAKGRLLTEIDLVEVSVVTEPADAAARITGLKSALATAESLGDIEDCLRHVGFSRGDALALVSRIKSALGPAPAVEDARSALRSILWRP